uniref:J domain-containing protein n=1 Tax=Meloidogyne enterolobii TaxID=390850 RepID=A0A6V7THH9_MELEN|nr:unnamed protein product [Meloidogyne enterolobii]
MSFLEINDCNNLYQIIGCSKNATFDQILVEYKQKALLLHPDKIKNKNISEDEIKENFQKLQFAKDILTNPQKRKHYDLWMDVGFSEFSLQEWMNNQEKLQQTLHWGQQKEKGKLKGISAECKDRGNESWKGCNSPTSRAFREYKI